MFVCLGIVLSYLYHVFSLEIEWNNIATTLPIPLYFSCIAQTTDDLVFIFGGYTTNKQTSRKVFQFNISTSTISELPILTPTNEFACVQSAVYSNITNKIYMFGIYTSDENDWEHTTTNYEFDPNNLTFTSIPQINNTTVVKDSCVAIHQSTIFLYGGWYSFNNSQSYGNLDTLYEYNIITKQWNQKKSNQYSINGACIVANNNLFVFGGATEYWDVTRTVYKYDIADDTWNQVPTFLKYSKWYIKAILLKSIPNTIAIIGGHGWSREAYQYIELFNYESYVIQSNVTRFESQSNQGGVLMPAEYTNGELIVFGGTDACDVNKQHYDGYCSNVWQTIYRSKTIDSTTAPPTIYASVDQP